MRTAQMSGHILYGRNDLFIVDFSFFQVKCGILCEQSEIWLYCYVLLCSEWVNWSLGRQMQQGCYTDA